ncbi:esterase-like activity of phytase family protein [Bacillus sp. AFS076308]|uniref:esterase-like activity of phytase family protein n=1 Tax=Bacillus sp. AFS076308 TaxID=2033512 RepID=UPI001C3F2CF8|nr:esterase-like activity of phytase family protein [Bacillus sp. AFS076308]
MFKKLRKKRRVLAALTLGTFLLGSAGVYAAQDGVFGTNLVGRQANGSVQTPVNQLITPAGKQIEFNGNPMSVAIHPNGKTAAVLNGKGQGLNMIDLTTGKQMGASYSLKLTSMWGLAYSKDGSYLYATGSSGSTGKIVAMSIAGDGTPTVEKTYNLPAASVKGNINPLDLTVGSQGQLLSHLIGTTP